jgi:hypothetical protein
MEEHEPKTVEERLDHMHVVAEEHEAVIAITFQGTADEYAKLPDDAQAFAPTYLKFLGGLSNDDTIGLSLQFGEGSSLIVLLKKQDLWEQMGNEDLWPEWANET